jgi:glycosyltransferase involved in cell wall biosynthesis
VKGQLPITVLLAVKNEEKNIRKCLSALMPVKEIIVIDSHSTDETVKIAEDEFGAKVLQFDYSGGFPKKRQWALETIEFKGDWILFLDADEVVPDTLWSEIEQGINSADGKNAYLIKKGFHFLGKRFRHGGFSHSAVLLMKKGAGRFEELDLDPGTTMDMEIHERVIVQGKIGELNEPLIHEDFKGLTAYLERHNQYSSWEAHVRHQYLRTGSYGQDTIKPRLFGNSQERRRFLKGIAIRVPFEPLLWFLYHYILCLGFLEGKRGFIACQIRSNYIRQVRSKLYELQLKETD